MALMDEFFHRDSFEPRVILLNEVEHCAHGLAATAVALRDDGSIFLSKGLQGPANDLFRCLEVPGPEFFLDNFLLLRSEMDGHDKTRYG
jgi:hypothetical protein